MFELNLIGEMNVSKEVDLRQLCRICAVDVGNETAQHSLIESNEITELGEVFISCLGIQVKVQSPSSFSLSFLFSFSFRFVFEISL